MPSVLTVREISDERRMRVDDRLGRQYTRCFRVETDSMAIGPSYIAFADGIPRVYDPYSTATESDPGSFVRSVEPTQDPEFPFIWKVRIEYSSATLDPELVSLNPGGPGGSGGAGGSGGQPQNENPLAKPTRWRIGTVRDQVPIELSADDPPKAILNSAGQPFAPVPMRDRNRPSFTATRNESTFNLAYWSMYQDHVNDSTWHGFPERVVKLGAITGEDGYENGISFWAVTYEFEVMWPDWDLHLLDKGRCELRGGKLVPAVNGIGVNGEFLLNGEGFTLGYDPNGPNLPPVYLDFDRYPSINFELLLGL